MIFLSRYVAELRRYLHSPRYPVTLSRIFRSPEWPGRPHRVPGGRVKGDDCIFDIKVMLTDEGKEGKIDAIDLCNTRTVTFN